MSLINSYRRKARKDFSLGKGGGPYSLPSPRPLTFSSCTRSVDALCTQKYIQSFLKTLPQSTTSSSFSAHPCNFASHGHVGQPVGLPCGTLRAWLVHALVY